MKAQMVNECPVCKVVDAKITVPLGGNDVYEVLCPVCGPYTITQTTAATDHSKHGPAWLLSGILRNRVLTGNLSIIGHDSFRQMLEATRTDLDPFEKLDLLLLHVHQLAQRIDRAVSLDPDKDYPLLFAQDGSEFGYLIRKAVDLQWLEMFPSGAYRLTLNGWKRLAELHRTSVGTNQAFVAMWFDSRLDRAWSEGFIPALNHCGYAPIRVDLVEHNEKICDRIIAEIRRSALVVADFTGQRGGVYFESGFAMGIGIPVIRTCRKDDVDKLHFDTRQYSHVVWQTPEDLKDNLIHRISATLPIKRQ